MYNFIKKNYIKVERGVEYINSRREVDILTHFWQKKEGCKNEPKMKKLIEKSKNNLKTQEIYVNFELEPHFRALQNTAVSISQVYISI